MKQSFIFSTPLAFIFTLAVMLSSCTSMGRLKIGQSDNLRTGTMTFGVDRGKISGGEAFERGGLLGMAVVAAFDNDASHARRSLVETTIVKALDEEFSRSQMIQYVPYSTLKGLPIRQKFGYKKEEFVAFAQTNSLDLVILVKPSVDYLYGGLTVDLIMVRADGSGVGSCYARKSGGPLNPTPSLKLAQELKKPLFDPAVMPGWREQAQLVGRELMMRIQR
ncbi:MAG: hypothetical protein ABL962_11650 [Fimbriimonadaceae bacterium]